MKKKVRYIILGICLIGGISVSLFRHSMKMEHAERESYISNELLELFSDTILKEREETVLKRMVSDKKLTEEEIETYTSDATVLAYNKQFEEYGGFVLFVDADNDGIKDFFFVINNGGSMGNNSRILLKGNKNGSFYKTSETVDVTQELAFINYEGINYLMETNFDYEYKQYNGIKLSYFKEGEIYETVDLTILADGYDVSIDLEDASYQTMAKEASEITKKYFETMNDNAKILVGDAETTLKEEEYKPYEKEVSILDSHWFCSDINNDGIKECYTKGIFLSSTIHTTNCLLSAFITEDREESGGYLDLLSYENIEKEGIAEMFWVSTVDKTNIVNLITKRGITDYAVSGYLIKNNQTSKVYEVNFTGRRKVETKMESNLIDKES